MKLIEIQEKLKSRLNFDGMVELAHLTAHGKIKYEDILNLCDYQDQQIAFRASWVLDFFAHANTDMFLTQLSRFLKLYPNVSNQSVQRNFTKIMMLLTEKKFMRMQQLEHTIFDDCLTASFDWLINPKTPIAVQANAIDVVFQLSPYHDWVLDELKVILQQKLVSGSAALTSRAKKVLKQIS